MEGNSPVSVIIPTLNEEKYLPLLLNSLVQIGTTLDVIVVDGNSEDGTRNVVQNFAPLFRSPSSLRLITSPQRGISLQRNLGAQAAKHSLLMFCDADIVFSSSETYRALISEFEKKQYVVAAPLLIPVEDTGLARLMYGAFVLFQKTFLVFGRPYFAGSCLLSTRETFEKIDGFDVSILLAEDVDYSFRAARTGLFGLLKTPILVSARRFVKYGYFRVFFEWIKGATLLTVTGKISPSELFYPFGEFNDSFISNPPR
jgi:glycosyltransferase involved in cell wall biosynthesis